MEFGEKLKKLRAENNITQKELAKKVGIKRGTVGSYETQGKKPRYETLKKIAQVLNCSIDYLLDSPNNLNQNEKNESNFDLQKYINKINERKDIQLLLKQVDKLNSDSVYRIIKILELLDEEVKNRKK